MINIKRHIKLFLKKNKIRCKVKEEKIHFNVPMSFSCQTFDGHPMITSSSYFGYNEEAIRYGHKHSYSHLSFKDFLNMMIAHEIGHYLDISNGSISLEINSESLSKIKSEKGAWVLGREYVPDNLLEDYDKMNKENLDLYKK